MRSSIVCEIEIAKRGIKELRHEQNGIKLILAVRRSHGEQWEIKYELASSRFEAALLRYVLVSQKAGFRSDQPRWPKGSGEDSGRWSGGAGAEEPSAGPAIPRARGHHLVPGEIYRNKSLQPETRKVFGEETIGPLRAQTHNNGDGHSEYNKAVKEAFDRFKAEHGIARSEEITPAQARKFLDEIRGSFDPKIRQFNMRIIMRELRFNIRRGRGAE